MGDLPSAVLFACTMNSIRSPMAEAILKFLHGTRIYVDSVGVRSREVDGFAIVVMDEIGIDLSRHNSKTFDDLDDSYYDLVIPMSPDAQHRAMEITRVMACEVEFWNTFDPSMLGTADRDQSLEAYRQVRDQLMQKIKRRFPLTSAADT
ncbi:MAG: low molecular weight phosphatase family protein [Magnetovibrio sp.]|mgnify:FL=1|nr:low molecular weight phosphatase family protein [Magnetovibrio sp.]